MAYALCISLCELMDALHSSVMFTLPILLFSGGYVSLFDTEYDLLSCWSRLHFWTSV